MALNITTAIISPRLHYIHISYNIVSYPNLGARLCVHVLLTLLLRLYQCGSEY